jgi:hypothetical protein
MGKLTETMLFGLRAMEARMSRQSSVLPEPNESTGKALEKRGLIEFVKLDKGWRYYRVTDAGRAALARAQETRS